MNKKRSSKVIERIESEKLKSKELFDTRKNGTQSRIEKPFKRRLFKKPLKILNLKPRYAVYFSIAGMEYAIKNIKAAQKLFEAMDEGDFVDIKHEHNNPHDDYALVIYYRGQKLGYVPKEINQELMLHIQHKNEMTFLIHKRVEFEDYYDMYARPEIIAIVYG